jgi:predicted metal-dependent HD superfamily phosphohydrolase
MDAFFLRERAPAGLDLPEALIALVAAAYAAPDRHYHSLTHLDEITQRFVEVSSNVGWQRPREVYLAMLFHDIVYVGAAKDNEARSAEIARAEIARRLPDAGIEIDTVAHLIELTATHGQATHDTLSPDAALFLDCDMAIVAADAARFEAYDAGVRLEYAFVPPDLYNAGRRAFLAGLLATERIFLSDYGHAKYDHSARANLRRALA